MVGSAIMSDSFSEKAPEFHLEEFKGLRKEVELLLEDYLGLERNVVVAIGASWAFLYHERLPAWTFLIPCLFAVLGAVRAKGIMDAFGVLSGYLKKLEIAYRRESVLLGWEHSHQGTGFSKGAVWFWSILIAATVLATLYVYWHPLTPIPSPCVK
jgi:hypothetical protein